MSQGNARTLRKVVPIAQKREVRGIMVTLSALELYHGGDGILRYLISHDPQTAFNDRFGRSLEPEIEAHDYHGNYYGWSPVASGGGDGETEGTLELEGLPSSGELEIRVVRVVSTEAPDRAVSEAHEGPWEFSLSV